MDWDPDHDAQARRDRIRNWVIVIGVTLAVIGVIAKLVLAYQKEQAEKRARFGHTSSLVIKR